MQILAQPRGHDIVYTQSMIYTQKGSVLAGYIDDTDLGTLNGDALNIKLNHG